VEALGAIVGVRSAVVVGGVDMMTQAIALSKKPHIIVCTPGRIVDHLENTKGFSLRNLKFLVLDEADRLLNMDFEEEITKVLKVVKKIRKRKKGRPTPLFYFFFILKKRSSRLSDVHSCSRPR